MTSVSIDTSEVRTLAADMRDVDSRLTRWIRPVVEKGANNIKRTMQSDLRESSHFAPVAQAVSYDIDDKSDGYSAEIGPAASGAGYLDNIAYFGSSQGVYRAGHRWSQIAYYGSAKGGGTVRDPQEAANEELPNFQRELSKLADELVLG